jgi:hypothetical protein
VGRRENVVSFYAIYLNFSCTVTKHNSKIQQRTRTTINKQSRPHCNKCYKYGFLSHYGWKCDESLSVANTAGYNLIDVPDLCLAEKVKKQIFGMNRLEMQ